MPKPGRIWLEGWRARDEGGHTISAVHVPWLRASWRAFIRNHLDSTAAIDFFTVPPITGRVLYVFLVLGHARRKVLHYHVTAKPRAEWVVRQLREAFPFDTAPKYLIHDNDGIFGEAASRMLRLLRIREVKKSPGSEGI